MLSGFLSIRSWITANNQLRGAESLNCRSVSRQFLRILWNPEIHYRIHNSPPLVTILIQAVFTPKPYLIKISLSIFFLVARQPLVDQDLFIIKASQSHSDTHTHTHSVGLLWMGDQPDAETSIWKHTTFTRNRQQCPRRDSNPQSPYVTSRRPGGHWDGQY